MRGGDGIGSDRVKELPDGNYLVTGNAKGLVQVWDANNGPPIREPIRTLGIHKEPTYQTKPKY